MNCPACGKQGVEGMAFCSGCGKKLAASPSPQKQPGHGPAQPVRSSPGDEGTKFDFNQFAGAAVAGDISMIADALSLPPPPPLPQGDWSLLSPGGGSPSSAELAELAAASGYSLYDPEMKPASTPASTPLQKTMAAVSMIFVFFFVAGMPLYPVVTAGMSSRKVSGLVENQEFRFRVVMPPGWRAEKNPGRKTRDEKTIGYFFKGSSMNPSIEAIFLYIQEAEGVPENISSDALEAIEPGFRMQMESFMGRMGMKYELLQTNRFIINHREAIWMDGNISCRGCDTRRNFTFFAFSSTSVYGIYFNFEEKDLDLYWPEIESILKSIEFLEPE